MHTRRAALHIMEKVEGGESFSSELLGRYAKDKNVIFPLLQRLVKGTISWREAIDAELKKLIPEREQQLLKRDWNILRIGAYQIQHFKNFKLPLVIKESSALASSRDQGERIASILFRLAAGVTTDSSQAGSHPEWILAEWRSALGEAETEKLCAANNRPWPVAIRVNTLKASPKELERFLLRDRVQCTRSSSVEGSLIIKKLPPGVRLHELLSFEKGLFVVQDESASLVGLLLAPKPGERVIDLCAAPGGKTAHLAQLMDNQGSILACDVHASALEKLRENCKKLGVRNVHILQEDGTRLKPTHPADAVLLDAPCSGLGVLGRKVDIRWSKSEANVTELCELQKKLLDHAATILTPGGRIVYSTCTIHRSENQMQVEAFLGRHPNFSLVPARERGLKRFETKEGYVLTLPHRHKMGGSFAALLQMRS